jgi:outer membrane protein TolC
VADDLRSVEHDAAHVSASRHALDVSRQSLELQRISYTAGKTTVLQLIDAGRTYAQAKLTLATSQIQPYQTLAGLFIALGGGGGMIRRQAMIARGRPDHAGLRP